MKMNKVLASMAAAALSVSAFAVMTINASADEEPTTTAAAAEEYNFYLGGKIGDKAFDGDSRANVKADKDGEYTLKIEGAAAEVTADNFALYLASDINKDEKKDAVITIDEVSVDGKAVEYKQSENAVTYSTDGTDKIKIAVFDGDIKDIAAPAAVAENVSVKFTVKNVFAAAEAETTTAAEETTTTSAEETTTTTADTTTTTTAASTTTTKAADTTKAAAESAAKTGDAGAAVAVAVLGVAAATAVTLRKKD